MVAAHRTSASAKQAICKKVVSILKKRYRSKIPKSDRTVLDTILYAICLENASARQADDAFARLESDFHDLNEIRVSSVKELESIFSDMEQPEWRALAIRTFLQHVFEKKYSFDFESIRRKTVDLANKQLKRIRNLSPFIRAYTLQIALGSHIIPIDESLANTAIWLGLADPNSKCDQASESIKPAVRKADSPVFCHLLRCLASDPKVKRTFDSANKQAPEDGYDVTTATERLTDLFNRADSRTKKVSSRKKSSPKKPASKKTASRKTVTSSSRSRAGGKSKSAAQKKVAKKRSTAKRGNSRSQANKPRPGR